MPHPPRRNLCWHFQIGAYVVQLSQRRRRYAAKNRKREDISCATHSRQSPRPRPYFVGIKAPDSAADYPARTITIVVPFAAGGPTDTVTRLVAEAVQRDLGRQIGGQNVGGAGGTPGAGGVAKAEPDGYTLLLHDIGTATSDRLYHTLPYKPREVLRPHREPRVKTCAPLTSAS